MLRSRFWQGLSMTVLLLVGLAMPRPCWAMKVGAFSVEPYISLMERYDSNITSTSSGVFNDFITGLTTGVDISLEEPVQTLKGSVSVRSDVYAKNSGFNNISEYVQLLWSRDLSKLARLSAHEEFTHGDEATSFADEFGRGQAGRETYYLNRSGLSFYNDLTSKTSLKLDYSNEFYSRSGAGSSDSLLHQGTLEVLQSITARTAVLASYGYSRRDYLPGDTVVTHNVDAGLRQYFTQQLYADVRVGSGFIRQQNGASSRGMRYSARLTNEINHTSRVLLSFSRENSTSYYSSSVFRRWSISGGYEHDFSQRLHGSTSIFTGTGKYLADNIKDTYYGIQVGLTEDVSKDGSIYLNNSFSSTSSTLDTRDYTRNVTEAGYRLKF